MTIAAYERLLAESGPWKLRATALLAQGDDESRFEAAVLLHDAVRAEARALEALEAPSPATRAGFAIERCFCLIDGLDPRGAIEAWGDVLSSTRELPEEAAAALRARIDRKYPPMERAFAARVQKHPRVLSTGAAISGDARERARTRRQVEAFLHAYPGLAQLWFLRCLLDEAAGELGPAWKALTRARRLQPDESLYDATSFWLAPRALSKVKLAAYLAGAEVSIQAADPVVRLLYSLAEIDSIPRGAAPAIALERLGRVERALFTRPLPPGIHERLQRSFLAVQLLARELRAGRPPTDEILYQAGLGELVVTAPPSPRRSPARLLAQSAVLAVQRAA